MRLFRSEEEKTAIDLLKQRRLFTAQYLSTVQYTLSSFQDILGLSNERLEDSAIQDGLMIWHDTIVVSTVISLRDEVKKKQAMDLLKFAAEARKVSGDITMPLEAYESLVIKANRAYVDTLRKVHNNGDDGITAPELEAFHAISLLKDVNLPAAEMLLHLPDIGTNILKSYVQYWNKNL